MIPIAKLPVPLALKEIMWVFQMGVSLRLLQACNVITTGTPGIIKFPCTQDLVVQLNHL